ncbi:hypothetical protein ACTXOY_04345 [Corynebacterium variabile]|uniref:hypothetical protein n=1 Tax=Corynebacterium variabile TaxID=1727 RepID=UPI003FD1D78C
MRPHLLDVGVVVEDLAPGGFVLGEAGSGGVPVDGGGGDRFSRGRGGGQDAAGQQDAQRAEQRGGAPGDRGKKHGVPVVNSDRRITT